MATATQQKSTTASARPSLQSSLGQLVRRPETGSVLGMIAVFVFFALAAGKIFLSPAGFASWLNVAAEIGIVALPSAC